MPRRRSILSAAERDSLLAVPDTKGGLIRHYFATVLRDSPVMRAISRSDLFFRACKCRILPIMSMVITPDPLLLKKAAE